MRPLREAFGRGVLRLIFLGPFFFITYGLANRYAAALDSAAGVPSFHYGWERDIPFYPWTIAPYWSIDFLYGLSFLCCKNKSETNRLALRLLSAQLIAVACFFLCPLRFAFERESVDGPFGLLFKALTAFDLPYNQAPSLHIALLLIVWRQFTALEVSRIARFIIHAWAVLIGVSVLTTWQHHFIDVPTGFLAGLLCLWLVPDAAQTPLRPGASTSPVRALPYLAGAALAAILAFMFASAAILFIWIALSLALTALNYLWAGAAGFQKHEGRHTLAARWLFAPYAFGAWINARLWTRRCADPNPVAPGLWIGRLPTSRELAGWTKARGKNTALFDLCAELPAPALPDKTLYDSLPCLDLVPLPPTVLQEAVRKIETLGRSGREVWIACALGCSRSAAVAAAWLLYTRRAATVRDAVTHLRRVRPSIVLTQNALQWLDAFEQEIVRSAPGDPLKGEIFNPP